MIPLNSIRKVVYFDENYPTVWIGDDAGKRIANYLHNKYAFQILNAHVLANWMLTAVAQNFAHESVVVFARDVAPSSVFEDPSPNCLMRRYLDAGGRIIWIGDIPLWYKGHPKNRSHKENREPVWQFLPFLSILGVLPVIAWCYRPVKIAPEGKRLGLRQVWYGNRPAAIYVNETEARTEFKNPMPNVKIDIQILAFSKPILVKHVLKGETGIMSWIMRRIGGIHVSSPVGGFGIDFRDPRSLYEWDKKFANAWKVTFNSEHPNQGFIRIWDKVIHVYDLTDETLDELNSIATQGLKV